MNWNQITRFCFTCAIDGGAWLEDASGYRNWESKSTIDKHMGSGWFERQFKRHGMFTGCWIDVDKPGTKSALFGRCDKPVETKQQFFKRHSYDHGPSMADLDSAEQLDSYWDGE